MAGRLSIFFLYFVGQITAGGGSVGGRMLMGVVLNIFWNCRMVTIQGSC
jgi:hypothetical protein